MEIFFWGLLILIYVASIVTSFLIIAKEKADYKHRFQTPRYDLFLSYLAAITPVINTLCVALIIYEEHFND